MIKKIKQALAYWLKDELLKYYDIRETSSTKPLILSTDNYTIETIQKMVKLGRDRAWIHPDELEFYQEHLLEHAKTCIEQYFIPSDNPESFGDNFVILKLRVLKRK